MKTHLYLLTLFLGVVLAVHLAMNGKVGSVLSNARVGNALFWCIGALGAVAIGLTGWQSGALGPIRQVHTILLTAGVLGATLVFAIAWLIPQVGAGPLMITLLVGQWLRDRGARSRMVIATKLGFDYPGCQGGLSAAEIERECEKSLRRLQTDTLDLYYAHRADPDTPIEETMEAFDRLWRAGKIRA